MGNPRQVVHTLTARCRDCHRCIRVCPVKAISIADGQAAVDEKRCIACGACIRECPQGAKTYRRDTDAVQSLIDSGARVAVSLAPSFAAAFGGWQRGRLVSALRRLGFCDISETAIGAGYSALQSAREMAGEHNHCICSACPAVVNFVEKYQPELAEKLVRAASPMLAHARHIKARLGADVAVVFIGPCVAKKTEAMRPDVAADVSAVLTFEELQEWLERKKIELASCEESDFDDFPVTSSRLFPLSGGLLKTAALDSELTSAHYAAVTGPASVREALSAIADGSSLRLEPLFCPEGCINGPGLKSELNLFARRALITDYNTALPQKPGGKPLDINLSAHYAPSSDISRRQFTPEQIQAEMERTGKGDKEQQLNCGACGYNSCREKAIAVLENMAVPEMCIPLMRRRAEQRTDKIISFSPNGIVLLNAGLEIVSMNQAFSQMFSCTDELIGKRISQLMDAEPFEKVASGYLEQFSAVVRHSRYGLLCRQIIYALPEENQVVGLFMGMDAGEDRRRIAQLRSQTVTQAQELLDHQISMAQELAKYLGESTARGEELVRKLITLSQADDKENRDL